MKLSEVNESLSLLANLGVLVGLIFLIVEINQSNRIALGTAESNIRVMASNTNNSVIENPQVADLMGKLTQPDPDLTVAETEQVRYIARQNINLWLAIERLYEQGLITRRSFEGWKTDPPTILEEHPGLLIHFEFVMRDFPRPFQLEMTQLISDEIDKLRL